MLVVPCCPLQRLVLAKLLKFAWVNGYGVLGVLASMMEHSCAPTCELEVAIPRQGSVITLRTIADVEAGQALSISYVGLNLPTAERLLAEPNPDAPDDAVVLSFAAAEC